MKKIFGYEPATAIAALNSVIALLMAFGLPLTDTQANAITTAATAVLGIAIAVMTRPILPATIATLVGTALTAVGAFGYHLEATQISSIVAVVSLLVGYAVRMFVSPSEPALALARR